MEQLDDFLKQVSPSSNDPVVSEKAAYDEIERRKREAEARHLEIQNESDTQDRVQGKLAEIARDYVKKGMKLAVIGKIRYREYEHQGVKRIATEIWASNFEMLGSPEKKAEQAVQPQQPAQTQQTVYANQVQGQENDDGLPF